MDRQYWGAIALVAAGCICAIFSAPILTRDSPANLAAGVGVEVGSTWGQRSAMFEPGRPDLVHFAIAEGGSFPEREARHAGDAASDAGGRPVVPVAAEPENPPPEGGLSAPDPTPKLRIDGLQHGAQIVSLDVDAAGRFAVTGSLDKTARIWAIPQREGDDFRPLTVLRPPIGDGQEGFVYAVAMSPDASLVAVAGWTGFAWHGATAVYLFERIGGRMVARLPGLPAMVKSLAFSPDGQTLVAGLGAGFGLRAWRRTPSGAWTQAAFDNRDLAFRRDVTGLDFVADGDGWSLAVGSLDGVVGLFDSELTLTNETRIGFAVLRVSFDPSGSRLAVGDMDRLSVAVLDGKSLNLMHRPLFRPAGSAQNVGVVEWSEDGEFLFAAGTASGFFGGATDDEKFVLVFGDKGRKHIASVPVAQDTIFGLQSVRGDQVLIASGDPQLAMFGAGSAEVTRLGGTAIDVRGSPATKSRNERSLRLSADGYAVSLPFYSNKEPTWRFNLVDRWAEAFDGDDETFDAPLLVKDGVSVENWIDSNAPRVNGKRLRLQPDEKSFTLAQSRRDPSFILGTSYYLRHFGDDGRVIWSEPAHGGAWQANVSADGRFAVAAFGDGTVRWFEIEDKDRDGRPTERLALYVVNDPGAERVRWVAWTPAGYYDASPGAEDLIGWHVNQGADREGLFYPSSRFRQLFYRPDIVAASLDVRAPCIPRPAAIGLSCERQPSFLVDRFGVLPPDVAPPPPLEAFRRLIPPTVRLVGQSEPDANGDVVIQYEIENPFNAPVDIDVFVDGGKVDDDGARNVEAALGRGSVVVPRGACASESIRIVARTGDGRSSAPLDIAPGRDRAACEGGELAKPKLKALLIGVADYDDDSIDLNFADDDARDFKRILEAQVGRAFSEASVEILTDKEATRHAIRRKLNELADATSDSSPRDVTVVFFSGHGASTADGGYYLLSRETILNDMRNTALDIVDFQNIIRRMKGRKFIFLDACYSNFGNEDGIGLFDMQRTSNLLGGSDMQAEVFASSTANQKSFERPELVNGAFTEAIIELFEGRMATRGDDADSLAYLDLLPRNGITNREIINWADHRVGLFTEGAQTPTHVNPIGTSFVLGEADGAP